MYQTKVLHIVIWMVKLTHIQGIHNTLLKYCNRRRKYFWPIESIYKINISCETDFILHALERAILAIFNIAESTPIGCTELDRCYYHNHISHINSWPNIFISDASLLLPNSFSKETNIDVYGTENRQKMHLHIHESLFMTRNVHTFNKKKSSLPHLIPESFLCWC